LLVIAVCVLLVAAGVALVVRWGGSERAGAGGWSRHVAASFAGGAVAGVLIAGAGGRLVMRLLALTSPDAEGSLTEAGEFIGEISAGGTLALILFGGIPAGVLSGAIYAVIRPLLPPARAGGALFGALLLVLAATRIDPLREENIDFALLGPGWLAVVAFVVLGVLHGMVVAAVAARIAPSPEVGDRAVLYGRVAVAALALAALPGFAGSVADIAG
jgi:hypothetical protein